MTIDEVIDQAGQDAFADFTQRAWATAADTGSRTPVEGEERGDLQYELVYDIVERIWKSDIADAAKVDLLFELYRRAPAYTWLNLVDVEYRHMSSEAQTIYWAHIRTLLAGEDDRLAQPAAYLLWCGPFEEIDRVEGVWNGVIAGSMDDRLLQRVLTVSGPVPYHLKRRLYEQLISDERWHYYIFRSLLHSTFDYFGAIDAVDGRHVLDRLRLSAETEELDLLVKELAARG